MEDVWSKIFFSILFRLFSLKTAFTTLNYQNITKIYKYVKISDIKFRKRHQGSVKQMCILL